MNVCVLVFVQHISHFSSITAAISDLVACVYHAHFNTVHFPACAVFQCSRSCGSGIQRREIRCAERDSQGGYVPSDERRDTQMTPHTVERFALSRQPVLSCSGMQSSPHGGAGIWLNLCWMSSRSATEVLAQKSLESQQEEQLRVLWSQAGTPLPGNRYRRHRHATRELIL